MKGTEWIRLLVLSGKGDECFSKFCDILPKSNNEVWAESLRAKAEEFKGGSGKTSTNKYALTSIYMPCIHRYMSLWKFDTMR